MIPFKLPKGTTLEQWEKYEKELEAHEIYCANTRPLIESYTGPNSVTEYEHAMTEWETMRFCDRPNEPGYYRANND